MRMYYDEVAKRLEIDSDFRAQMAGILARTSVDFCKLFREASLDSFVEKVRHEANRMGVDDRTLLGAIYFQLAGETYACYQEKGLDEKIYWDTMSDLKIWAENCYHEFGIWGIAEYGWLAHHMRLEIVRLGRLQFQPMVLGKTIRSQSGKVKKGTLVLNVHIPQGEPLTYEACEDAYRQARLFFKNDKIRFVCESWLLNPVYQELLSADSNIVRFQKTFEIYDINHECRQAEERIFGQLQDDPNHYQVKTRLQKIAVNHLKAGKRLGSAKGVV